MTPLYVTEAGAVVRQSGESIIITLDEDPDGSGPLPEKRRRLLETEMHRLELIALVGRAHITADATRACLDKGIAVVWFSWNGSLQGRMVPAGAKCADLRLLQYAAATDAGGRLARAVSVIRAKLENALEVLEDLRGN
ncbi:MAG: CRISPR-associated endonuclease Cas1, partial [Planctomycetes bacterium]|nr:CRISPR-associated endonuclease Cas1 [Planctomycetota bacterium]